jgi:hypothetical protein
VRNEREGTETSEIDRNWKSTREDEAMKFIDDNPTMLMGRNDESGMDSLIDEMRMKEEAEVEMNRVEKRNRHSAHLKREKMQQTWMEKTWMGMNWREEEEM